MTDKTLKKAVFLAISLGILFVPLASGALQDVSEAIQEEIGYQVESAINKSKAVVGIHPKKIEDQVEVFEEVAQKSKAPGIHAKNLEDIASKARESKIKLIDAREKNDTKLEREARSELAGINSEFHEEIKAIRKGQDKREVEEAVLILYEAISDGEAMIVKLESKEVDTSVLKIKQANVKSRVSTAESYYESKNYNLAEKEATAAFEEFDSLMSEVRPLLEMHNLTMGG